MQCRGANIIVTGSSGNFGSFIMEEFLKLGNQVVGLDIDIQNKSEADSAYYVQCDLTKPSEVYQTIDQLYKEFGQVDVLVNNAGKIFNSPLVNLFSSTNKVHSTEDWSKIIDLNMTSVFNITSELAFRMIKNKNKGVIINMSSISASGNIGQSAYSAAKGALNALTVTWSKELSMFGIRCNAIAPGFFDTQSTKEALDEKIIEKWRKEVPLRRLGKREELFHAIKFIIENDYYNGQVLHLDGGLRI